MFLGENHARLLWLPLFWGSTPLEAAKFLSMSQTIAQHWSGGYQASTTTACEALLNSTWSWFGPRGKPATFRSYLGARLGAAGLDASLHDVAREAALHLIAGWQARHRESRRCIHPAEAVQAAIDAILEDT